MFTNKEPIMSALLSRFFSNLFSRDQAAYLESSTDLAELERRMREIDAEDHAYSMSFSGSISRGNH
jgi:hypothetical protein